MELESHPAMSEEQKTTIVLDGDPADDANALASHPILLQYSNHVPVKRFALNQPSLIIGRKPDVADICLNDPSVSRAHCRIEWIDQRLYVTDLGSANSTYVNHAKISEPQELTHGDTLRVGNTRFRYYARGSTDLYLFDSMYQAAVLDQQLQVFRKEYLLETLEENSLIARETGKPLTLMFIDLDRFKSVNDTYGHDAGDHVLKEVCQTIKTAIRDSDTFGRYGGEEFCILLPGSDLTEACEVAERVRATVEQTPIYYGEQMIPVTVSIGVAAFTDDMDSIEDLIKLADEMVYLSKANGRNQVSHT